MRRGVAGLALFLAALAGCIEYEERLELDADGNTGSLKIHLGVAEQMVSWAKPKNDEVEQVFPLTVPELRKELDSDAMALTDARAESTRDMRHLYLVCQVKDASRLTASPALSERKLSIKPLPGGGWSFSQELTVSEESLGPKASPSGVLKQLEDTLGKEQLSAMLGRYHLTFSVSAPAGFVATSPDGKIHRKNTVVWTKSLAELLYNRQAWKMEASFAKAQ